MRRDEPPSVRLCVSPEEARHAANLLRYALSLNTTVGLVKPERRLTSPTYRAAELAARLLEGETFEEANEAANRAWTGSLEEDHRRALTLLQDQRDALTDAMSGRLTPDQLAQYLEVTQEQFLELARVPIPPRRGPDDPAS